MRSLHSGSTGAFDAALDYDKSYGVSTSDIKSEPHKPL